MQGVNPTRPHPLAGAFGRSPSPFSSKMEREAPPGLTPCTPTGAGGDAAATLPIFFENGEGSPTRVRWMLGGGSNSRGDAMLSRFLDMIADRSGNKKAQDEQPSRAKNYYSTNVLSLQEAGDNE